MSRFVLILFSVIFCSMLQARTNSYFTMTGDRVMVNLQSGRAFSADDDAIKLFKAMNVIPSDSIMGKGKKIQWQDALTIIVSDRGQGQFDGTIMIYRGPGTKIDSSRKTVEINWQGEEVSYLYSVINHENGTFEFTSADGRLKIDLDQNQFNLKYDEYQ